MISRNVRWLAALVVALALVGAIGLVSADMNSSQAETESEYNHMEVMIGHMHGEMGDHMDGDMMEQMPERMMNHEHGDYHERGMGHC